MMYDHKGRIVRFSVLLGIVVFYFVFVSWKYGAKDGFLVTLLTWSFFVLCTPVADAGFLVDFPVRLIVKLRMIYSEILVWVIAILLNLSVLLTDQQIYSKTVILLFLHHILSQPIPFWSIVFLSGVGTFLSIHLADELFDLTLEKHHEKYRRHKDTYQIVAFIFVVVMILVLYDFLIKQLGIEIPL
jgi:hypothetical protein